MNLMREIMNLSPERIKRMNFLLLRIRAMIMVNVLILLLIFYTHPLCKFNCQAPENTGYWHGIGSNNIGRACKHCHNVRPSGPAG